MRDFFQNNQIILREMMRAKKFALIKAWYEENEKPDKKFLLKTGGF